MNAIEIKNLQKKFKDKIAVNSINLDIKEGELFALLGVNGAGKTTTIKMLSGLSRPTSGDALIFNKSILNYYISLTYGPQSSVFADFFFLFCNFMCAHPFDF